MLPLGLTLVLVICSVLPVHAAKTGKIRGTIFTVSPAHAQTLWPNARVTLKNLESGNEVSTISSDLGTYVFVGVPVGKYEVTVTLAGFETNTKQLTLQGGDAPPLDFQLTLKERKESVTVSAETSGVDVTSSSGGTPELTQDTLKSVIRLNQDFQDALPLLPGVVRGFDVQSSSGVQLWSVSFHRYAPPMSVRA